jgi:hypothetical protein
MVLSIDGSLVISFYYTPHLRSSLSIPPRSTPNYSQKDKQKARKITKRIMPRPGTRYDDDKQREKHSSLTLTESRALRYLTSICFEWFPNTPPLCSTATQLERHLSPVLALGSSRYFPFDVALILASASYQESRTVTISFPLAPLLRFPFALLSVDIRIVSIPLVSSRGWTR